METLKACLLTLAIAALLTSAYPMTPKNKKVDAPKNRVTDIVDIKLCGSPGLPSCADGAAASPRLVTGDMKKGTPPRTGNRGLLPPGMTISEIFSRIFSG